MADKKISQLTAATIPLAGTEVLPIIQGTTTVKVTNNDLRPKQIQSNATSGILQVTGPAAAATRVMTTPDADFTVARTDAGQTFTGQQIFDTTVAKTSATVGGAGLDGNFYLKRADGVTVGTIAVNSGTGSIDLTTAYGYITLSNYLGEQFKIDNGNVKVTSGNLVIGTSGKGIDFSATSEGSGTMTSELLADYEEGTWTPTDASGAGLTLSVASANYTKIGNTVRLEAFITYPANASGASALLGGLPFSSAVYAIGAVRSTVACVATALSTNIYVNDPLNTAITNVQLTGSLFIFTVVYNV